MTIQSPGDQEHDLPQQNLTNNSRVVTGENLNIANGQTYAISGPGPIVLNFASITMSAGAQILVNTDVTIYTQQLNVAAGSAIVFQGGNYNGPAPSGVSGMAGSPGSGGMPIPNGVLNIGTLTGNVLVKVMGGDGQGGGAGGTGAAGQNGGNGGNGGNAANGAVVTVYYNQSSKGNINVQTIHAMGGAGGTSGAGGPPNKGGKAGQPGNAGRPGAPGSPSVVNIRQV